MFVSPSFIFVLQHFSILQYAAYSAHLVKKNISSIENKPDLYD